MAPPPPADLPLGQRLARLTQTLQFCWFAGHLALLIALSTYSLSWITMNYYSGSARFCYRLNFLSAALTYGIVVYKTWRARQRTGARQPGGPLGYIADENIQYLIMAIVWLFMPQYPLAMLPYGIYSIFHVATYTRANLIPTVIPPQVVTPAGSSPNGKPQYAAHPLADAIGGFVKQYYDMSMSIVAALEISLWFRIALAALFFQRRSWILIVIYTVFLRARFSQSSHVQNAFSQLEARLDNLAGNQGTPPAARQAWEGAKGLVRQFYSATDINKYVSGGAAPKKTS